MSAFEANLAHLRDWIGRSAGQPIELGDGSSCALSRTPRPARPSAGGASTAMAVPEPYRRFVSFVGGCELFYAGAEARRGVRFLWPEEIGGWLDELGVDGLSRWLPVGGNEDVGELFAIDLERLDAPAPGAVMAPEPERRTAPFTAVWHEYAIEDWRAVADELQTWTSFEAALASLIASRGREPLS